MAGSTVLKMFRSCLLRWHPNKKNPGKTELDHWCEVEGCKNIAPFGFGVFLKKGKVGHWYCGEHRVTGDEQNRNARKKGL